MCKHVGSIDVRRGTYIWMPEVDLQYIPNHSLPYCFETGSVIEPESG